MHEPRLSWRSFSGSTNPRTLHAIMIRIYIINRNYFHWLPIFFFFFFLLLLLLLLFFFVVVVVVFFSFFLVFCIHCIKHFIVFLIMQILSSHLL